jgi:hypothetical protein
MQAYNLQARNNSNAQIQLNCSMEIYGLDTDFNLGTQVKFVAGSAGQLVVYNWTPNGTATKVSLGSANNFVFSHREGGNIANNNIYSDYGTITTNGVIGETGAGVGWKLSPNASALASSPLRASIGKVPCPAGILTTVTFWAKCSASPGINAQLKVFGGRYPGVGSPASDVTTNISGTAWTQYSIVFQPSESCVVDLFCEAWGTAVENVTISGPITITQ